MDRFIRASVPFQASFVDPVYSLSRVNIEIKCSGYMIRNVDNFPLFWNKSGIFVNCSVIFCNNSPEELPACSLMPAHVIALQHDALCILTLGKYLGKCEYFYAF